MQKTLVELLAGLTIKLEDMGVDLGQASAAWRDYPLVFRLPRTADLERHCSNVLSSAAREIERRRATMKSAVVGKAKAYIDGHYREDLSLHDVAGHVYLSPIYFSHLFKDQTGTTFIDYLTNVRMERAAALMRERRHRIYEICRKVGYGDCKYFSKRFRQHHGVSPSEYYRNIGGDEQTNRR